MSRVYGYCRVSSEGQGETPIAQQRAQLIAAGVSVGDIHQDIQSGTKDNRPQYQELLSKARMGLVSKIIVTEISRLSRNGIGCVNTYYELLGLGVEIKSLREPAIDITTQGGLLQLFIYAGIAQGEVMKLTQRVRDGWKHVRQTNKAVNPPFGYAVIHGRYGFDQSEFIQLLEGRETLTPAQIGRWVVETFLEKRTLRQTVKAVNERFGIERSRGGDEKVKRSRNLFGWSVAGLKKWITNPVLRGHTSYLRGKEIILDTHPHARLISEEEFAQIEHLLSSNKQLANLGGDKSKYPFSGLVKCACCKGAAYSVQGNWGKVNHSRYYQCFNYSLKSCSNKKLVRLSKIENAAYKALVDYRAGLIDELDEINDEFDDRLAELEGELEGLQALASDNFHIKQAIEGIENQINAIHEAKSRRSSINLSKDKFNELIDGLQLSYGSAFEAESKPILQRLIKTIWINAGEVHGVDLRVSNR